MTKTPDNRMPFAENLDGEEGGSDADLLVGCLRRGNIDEARKLLSEIRPILLSDLLINELRYCLFGDDDRSDIAVEIILFKYIPEESVQEELTKGILNYLEKGNFALAGYIISRLDCKKIINLPNVQEAARKALTYALNLDPSVRESDPIYVIRRVFSGSLNALNALTNSFDHYGRIFNARWVINTFNLPDEIVQEEVANGVINGVLKYEIWAIRDLQKGFNIPIEKLQELLKTAVIRKLETGGYYAQIEHILEKLNSTDVVMSSPEVQKVLTDKVLVNLSDPTDLEEIESAIWCLQNLPVSKAFIKSPKVRAIVQKVIDECGDDEYSKDLKNIFGC